MGNIWEPTVHLISFILIQIRLWSVLDLVQLSYFLPEKVEWVASALSEDNSGGSRSRLTQASCIARTLQPERRCRKRQEGWEGGKERVAGPASFLAGYTWREGFHKHRYLRLLRLLLLRVPLWIEMLEFRQKEYELKNNDLYSAMLQAFFTLPPKVFQIVFFFQKFVEFWREMYLKLQKFFLEIWI